MSEAGDGPFEPSALWRGLSAAVMFGIGGFCRSFMLVASKPEINGLESFLELVDSRRDPRNRERGLVTGMCSSRLAEQGN